LIYIRVGVEYYGDDSSMTSSVPPPSQHSAVVAADKSTRGVKPLFAKYQGVKNPDVVDFISSIPDTFSDAVNRLMTILNSDSDTLQPTNFFSSPNSSNTEDGASVAADSILNNRVMLQKFISKFHLEAGTTTPSVSNSIALLADPTTRVFVSIHQPNLFAYSGVFKKIVLLQTLKSELERKISRKQQERVEQQQQAVQDRKIVAERGTEKKELREPRGERPKPLGDNEDSGKIVNLFLIVDHDFMDGWIRVAHLPSVNHSLGRLELRLPVNTSNMWQMAHKTPVPGRRVLDSWRKQVISWIRRSSASSLSAVNDNNNNRLLIRNNFEQFWQEVEFSYSKAKSYADFNSFLMSQIVNKIWGYDTLFVRLSEISPVFKDGFKYLVSNFAKYSDALRNAEDMFLRHGIDTGVSSSAYLNAPVWLHCDVCGSKASAKLYREDIAVEEKGGKNNEQGQEQKQDEKVRVKQIVLKGICMSCKKYLQVNLGDEHALELLKQEGEQQVLGRLSPRAIPILLLLCRDLGITCYASGTGGSMDYTVVGSLAFKELSIGLPLLTLVWPSKDVYYGFGQLEALELVHLAKQSDVIQYLESLKQKDYEFGDKIKPLIEKRNHRVKSGESIEMLLLELFNLKEEQRKIRRLIKMTNKVKNAVNMSPCFIDYAVNFGIADTERQWRESLLRNDDNKTNSLSSPILMKTCIQSGVDAPAIEETKTTESPTSRRKEQVEDEREKTPP
jgi:hypothetical protein